MFVFNFFRRPKLVVMQNPFIATQNRIIAEEQAKKKGITTSY